MSDFTLNSSSKTESDSSQNDRPHTGLSILPVIVYWLFAGLILLYYIFLITFWDLIIKVFNLFQNSTEIVLIYYSKIVYLFFHPVFTDIAILVAFGLGILYIILSIENYGHMIFSHEGKDVHSQNGLIAIFILALFNGFFLVPYCWFLFSVAHRLPEALFVLVLAIISTLFVFLFSDFAKMMQNYEKLNEFCKEIKPNQLIIWPSSRTECLLVLIINKSKYRDVSVLLMIVSVFLAYRWNLNLLTLGYMELILFFCMCIILMLSFPLGPIKGPVNILLTNGEMLSTVFIIEESEKGYILVMHKDMTQYNENIIKKVMTSSIVYIEPFNKKIKNEIVDQTCE
jgi:hypothetical protein